MIKKQLKQRLETDFKHEKIFSYMQDNFLSFWHCTQNSIYVMIDKDLNLVFSEQFTNYYIDYTKNDYCLTYFLENDDFYNKVNVFADEIDTILLADRLLTHCINKTTTQTKRVKI